MKQLICLLLVLCLLCPCLLLTGCTPDEEPDEGNNGPSITDSKDTPTLKFTLLDDGTYSVSKGGLGYAKEIVIPETYEGKPVTQIAASGFAQSGFEKITIPASIKVIGAGAFSGCADFKEITLPQGITEIGNNTFDGCVYLESIDIPVGVTRIGSYAFAGCTSLTTVTVPEGVTDIGEGAFWGSRNITTITLPNTLKRVGGMAFAIIGEETLEEPHVLQYNHLDGNKYLGNAQNPRLVLVELGDKSVEQYVLPTDTRIVYSYAFWGAAMSAVYLHTDVTGISAYAFYECTNLTSVHIPDKVTVIGEYAFYNCSSLRKVTGMNFVEEIGTRAFRGCTGSGAPANCFEINIGSFLKTIGTYCFPYTYTLKCTTENKVTYLGNASNPYVLAIDALSPSSTNHYTINPNTKIIYEDAFANCDLITEIVVPDGVIKLAANAFESCDNLSYVSLPNSLEIIEEGAFRNCKRLPSIIVPKNVIYIGDGAFNGCTGIAKITLPFVGRMPNGGGNALFGSIFGAQNVGQQVSRVPKALHNVVITGSTSIGNAAFSDCESIESITLPASLKYIGEGAFFFAKNLKQIYIEDIAAYCNITMVSAASTPFTNEAYLYLNNKRVKELTIPDGVESIPTFAFFNCQGLTKVTIPDSVTLLGDDCFKNCKALTTVEFGKNVTEIRSSAFENCAELVDLVLPENLEILESSSLRGCSKLTEITLPKTLRFIGDRAFKSCDSLEKVTFENKSGWQAVTGRLDTKGEKMMLWMKGKNATYLVEDFTEYYWVCNK